VLTHLRREAQPLVRYRTGDVVEIHDTAPCPCGRGSFRFLTRGRSDEMFVVRGINVFPSAIAAVLRKLDPPVTEFLVRLPPSETFDAIPLEIELPPQVDDPPSFTARVVATIKRELGCSATVEPLPHGSVPYTEGKTRRVIREEAPARRLS